MKAGNRKISEDHHETLIDLYMKSGASGVAAISREMGLGPRYVANLALSRGLRRKSQITCSPDTNDPRWQKALADGLKQISLEDAKDLGLPKYFTGQPCARGHIAQRHAARRTCCECIKEINQRPSSIEKMKAWYSSHSHQQKMLMWAKYRHIYGKYAGTFNLTEADLEWPEYCPALGIKLKYEAQRSRNANDAPTIDRIDPSQGYIKGNIQILSRKANRIKNDGSPEEVMRVALFMAGAKNND